MTPNEKATYAGLCLCRNTEVTQRWARTLIFFVVHSAGLTFAASRTQPTFSLLFFISLGGLVLVGVWFVANRRTTQWIDYWQSRLAALERSEEDPITIGVFTGPEWERMLISPVRFAHIVNILIVVVASIWLSLFLRSFF